LTQEPVSMPLASLNILRDRADMLSKARSFFADRNILEVDCPILSRSASVDAHIDLIYSESSNVYLHSSPEYGMKKLLALGTGDFYQLSHVFRAGEEGKKHRPEFMMAEWYRIDFSYEQMIEETCAFIQLFVGPKPVQVMSYREAFMTYAGIDPFYDSIKDHVPKHAGAQTRDDLLNILLALKVEPHLGQDGLTVITHYPASQCALAKTKTVDGEPVAKRFEVYYKGLELANGYDELTDAKEQRRRFIEANELRVQMGKEPLPIDEEFLESLGSLPDCCGVAVGFDRLMMLRHKTDQISDVIL